MKSENPLCEICGTTTIFSDDQRTEIGIDCSYFCTNCGKFQVTIVMPKEWIGKPIKK